MSSTPAAHPAPPAAVWKALARRLCQPGRDRIKVFDPHTRDYLKTRRITDTLPTLMAAVHLYSQRRTTLLALDFDTKRGGADQVDTDFARARDWLTGCGARLVTDRSTSGGRHILVPLAIGTTAGIDEVAALMRQLAARLPSLDPTPMQNAAEGCIAVPGTPCAGGGHRVLDGGLYDAVNALTERSDPALLPRLYALLGTLPASLPHSPTTTPSPTGVTIGTGEDQRLAEHARWTKPLPADVETFATTGALTRHTWTTPSEARMSVVLNAVLRGDSLADIRTRTAPGQPWAGLGDSYRTKHGPRADTQLARDVTKALHYTATAAAIANPPAHRSKNSQRGEAGYPPTGPHGRWLASALAWVDREFAGNPMRWTIRDVYQALAVKAALAGEIKSGVPVVGVGGRSLSLSAGLMPATTVFDVLRRTRDMVGAPILLIRPRVGRDADYYALTTPAGPGTALTPLPADRLRVSDVHPAWSVLGRHHRLVHDLIVHTGMTRPADIYAAARISPRTGQLTLAALATAGLITRTGRTVAPGTVTLDDVAAAHHLDHTQAERIARYRRERAAWHDWLALRDQLHPLIVDTADTTTPPPPLWADHDDYLATVLAHGPPDIDDEHHAIELLADLMGARVITKPRPPV